MRYLNLRIPVPDPGGFSRLRSWLPSRGNVLFTLLVVAGLLWATNAGALPLRAPAAATTSTGTIAYQGRLADSDGNPITDTVNMEFRLYDAAEGGTPLWSELWTGSNAVRVSDGLFNVMLGSLEPIPQNVVAGHDQLWLGITVGTDDEMSPRVQLGSVPFAVQALTVPDGSVTTAKLADEATTQAVIVNAAGEVNNDTTDWEDMPGMVANVTTEGGPVLVNFHAQYSRSVGEGAGIVLRLNIDGQDIGASHTNDRVSAANVTESVSLVYATELSPGEHTIKIRWRMSNVNGTGTMETHARQLVVTEFKR